ncbi:copper transporter [Nocardioides marmorisolisilvae]|uniref:Copper transporter n=1 Tax=Nocardioides marmorisolisilvae TaxID=1542737 RepID=A0A3N0DUH1_9ACTN|nr:copper transporter [Nocardioides marmorisolisilvae]RNL79279.1 copper transporter [Nocardioides marmorisolisilvae]
MRSWVMRLVGVALVLALGIAIGAGPLQKSNQTRDDELTAQKRKVVEKEHQIASLRAGEKYSSAYAAATAPDLVRNVLKGRSVTVLALPGADPNTVGGVRNLIAAAGGKVTAQVTFKPVMGRASSRQLVEALTSQMATQNPDLQIPATASGFQRFGLLLARAVGLPADSAQDTAPYDETAVGIVSGLQTAGLVTATDPTARADLTVAVTGPAAENADAAGANAVPATILQSYAGQAPVVVAGPASAAGPLGVLGSLRSGGAVAGLSTVDTAESVSGQVTTILALAALGRGNTGSWGGVDAKDGPVPPLS